MDWKIFATVFGTVFLAELGDKTQLATVLFASKTAASLWTIFIAASVALVLMLGDRRRGGGARLAICECKVSVVRGRHRLHRNRCVDARPSGQSRNQLTAAPSRSLREGFSALLWCRIPPVRDIASALGLGQLETHRNA